MMSPAFADDDGGDYEAAPVALSAQQQQVQQDEVLDDYDDGDYAAAPVSWDAGKAKTRPSVKAKQPSKEQADKVSKGAKQAGGQHWAKLAPTESAFE